MTSEYRSTLLPLAQRLLSEFGVFRGVGLPILLSLQLSWVVQHQPGFSASKASLHRLKVPGTCEDTEPSSRFVLNRVAPALEPVVPGS